jgi:hypothetical protein
MPTWSDVIAVYAALISTYTGFKWMIEARPYLTVVQLPRPQAGAIPVKIHNPGRRTVFIVGEETLPVKNGNGLDPKNGLSMEYGALLLSGRLSLAILPGESAILTIGPIHDGVDTLFRFRWHRGRPAARWWSKIGVRFFNPLKIRLTDDLETLVREGRTDFS